MIFSFRKKNSTKTIPQNEIISEITKNVMRCSSMNKLKFGKIFKMHRKRARKKADLSKIIPTHMQEILRTDRSKKYLTTKEQKNRQNCSFKRKERRLNGFPDVFCGM
jgi:hypothetical protein